MKPHLFGYPVVFVVALMMGSVAVKGCKPSATTILKEENTKLKEKIEELEATKREEEKERVIAAKVQEAIRLTAQAYEAKMKKQDDDLKAEKERVLKDKEAIEKDKKSLQEEKERFESLSKQKEQELREKIEILAEEVRKEEERQKARHEAELDDLRVTKELALTREKAKLEEFEEIRKRNPNKINTDRKTAQAGRIAQMNRGFEIERERLVARQRAELMQLRQSMPSIFQGVVHRAR